MRPTFEAADAVDALLERGERQIDICRQTGAPKSYVQHRRRRIEATKALGASVDSSCPKFADDIGFCTAVQHASPGGMPVLVLDGPARGAWITVDRRPWRQAVADLATWNSFARKRGWAA